MGPFPELRINSFRGLQDLRLEECGPVNLLVGGNNCGKTSVLEALLLLGAPIDVRQWEAAVQLRTTWPLSDMRFGSAGQDRLDALTWLFPHHGDSVGPIDLAGGGSIGRFVAHAERIFGEPPERPVNHPDEMIEASFRRERRRNRGQEGDEEPEPGLVIDIKFDWTPPQPMLFEGLHDRFRMVLWQTGRSYRVSRKFFGPNVPVAFATPISHRSDGYLAARVSRVLRAKKKEKAIELLQRLDPRVLDLVMVSPDDAATSGPVPVGGRGAALHVEYDGTGLVPVHAMGDGMRRALHFAAMVAETKDGGVLLVDEIEVGMHTSVLQDVFAWLCQACRDANVQLFTTTHSLEAVDAMLEGVPDEDVVLYRIKKSRARRFSGDLLRTTRMHLGQEVR